MTRQEIATQAMCALIATRRKYNTKKQLCDNAIAFADMLTRRLAEIPTDAQQRSEAGQDINEYFAPIGKKVDAAEVIEWIKNYASLFVANWASMENIIEQFKIDFKL